LIFRCGLELQNLAIALGNSQSKKRQNMTELTLEELCKRAVRDRLVYSCGVAPTYETYDSTTESIKPVPPKPWYVKITPNEPEQYFTNEELYEYLSKLSR
jgi:hypothetical protein